VTRARELRAELEARGAAIRDLAARCVAAVTPAPRLAVPDVAALGPVPQAPADVDAYLARLATVSRALNLAHAAYATALEERDVLRGQLEAYAIKASRALTSQVPTVPIGGARDDLGELFRRAAARSCSRAEPTWLAPARWWQPIRPTSSRAQRHSVRKGHDKCHDKRETRGTR
jgi:hypothetical protein